MRKIIAIGCNSAVFGIPPVLTEEINRLANTSKNETKAKVEPDNAPRIGTIPVATKRATANMAPMTEPNALCNDF
jgi:hypothetical protein